MGEQTGIGWTDSTINCWHGCSKVSAGCSHCYAEVSTPVRVKRAAGLELWGANAARSETKGWEASLRSWGHEVVRRANPAPWRIFGQSLSDTFEDRRDLDALRARFFRMLTGWEQRSLVFQLLTKRPENILRMVPPLWLTRWPAHVWIGATVEDQANADERIPHLLRVPAAVRFLSVEPQVGPVDLTDLVQRLPAGEHHYSALDCDVSAEDDEEWGGASVSWVIQGGESGGKARPFDLAWARSMRDQCRAAGVPYFLKQVGAYPIDEIQGENHRRVYKHFADSHGADESEWPADLRNCRAFPEVRRG